MRINKISTLILISGILFLTGCNHQDKPSAQIGDENDITSDSVFAVQKEKRMRLKHKMDSLNLTLEWKELKSGLWISKNGDLGIPTLICFEEGVWIDDFITRFGPEKQLTSVIDTGTFENLGNEYYRDKNYIYNYYPMAHGGIFRIMENVDYSTFEVVGDCYAKDKNHIFTEKGTIIDSADYTSFSTIKGIGCFAKDKYSYYFWDEKLDPNNDGLDSITLVKIKELDRI